MGSGQQFKDGNVGTGTTSVGYTLTVNGTAWCTSGLWAGSDLRWKEKKNGDTHFLSTKYRKKMSVPIFFVKIS